jgi:hypothetical protein
MVALSRCLRVTAIAETMILASGFQLFTDGDCFCRRVGVMSAGIPIRQFFGTV